MTVELHLEHILGRQEGVDMFGQQGHLAFADAVEQCFQHMRDFGEIAQPEGGCTALDGMGRAKDGIELVGIRRRDVDCQKQLLHFPEQFIGFIEEGLEELAHVNGHDRAPSLAPLFSTIAITQ